MDYHRIIQLLTVLSNEHLGLSYAILFCTDKVLVRLQDKLSKLAEKALQLAGGMNRLVYLQQPALGCKINNSINLNHLRERVKIA